MANAMYTERMFLNDVNDLLNGNLTLEDAPVDDMLDKVEAKLAQLDRRADYAAKHPRKSAAKGPNESTKARMAEILPFVTTEPQTASELCAAGGLSYSALQVSTALKYADTVKTTKVIRMTTGKDGMKAEKPYTAYFLG